MMTKYQSDIIRSRVALWRDDRGMPHGDGIFDLYVQDVSLLLAEVDRLTTELKDAEEDATLAETQLSEIVELVGEGGDGSAFGSVESMLATFTHREEMLAKQRDKAEAEVERLTAERDTFKKEAERFAKAIHTRGCQQQSAYNATCVCGADEYQRDLRTLAFKRGVAAMREAAANLFQGAADKAGLAAMPTWAEFIRSLPDPEDKP